MTDTPTISPRRERTRQRLMAAAESVIAEKGFAAASVEEICERAGFTRGAFYSNFDTKDDLALALLRANADGYLAGADRAIAAALAHRADDDPVEDLIERAVDTFVATQPSERTQLLLEAELKLHAARNPDFGAAYARFDAEMTRLFGATIRDTLGSRGLCLVIEPHQAIEMLHAVHSVASMDSLLPGGGRARQSASMKTLLLALVRRP